MTTKKETSKKSNESKVSKETEVVSIQEEKDTYSYKGWLNSDFFWKRALAVMGYYFVGYFMILIVILGIIFIFAFIGLLIGLMIS